MGDRKKQIEEGRGEGRRKRGERRKVKGER